MANWIQNCQICNDGLCIRMEELKKTHLSERQAAEVMQEEAYEAYPELKGEFSASRIRDRFRYHMKGKVGEISPPKASWPMCKKCGKKPVGQDLHSVAIVPAEHGLCLTCHTEEQPSEDYKWKWKECGKEGIKTSRAHLCQSCQAEADEQKFKKEIDKRQQEIDETPVDAEVEQFWIDYIAKFGGSLFKAGFYSGKVGPELLGKLKNFKTEIEYLDSALPDTIWSSQAFEQVD